MDKRWDQRQEWRIRPWIRVAAVFVTALLGVMNLPSMEYRLNPEGLSGGDEVVGYALLAVAVAATWLLTFRPHVQLTADGTVSIRNPIRRWTFPAAEVEYLTPTPYGVTFVLRDGRRPWTIVFQATMFFGEPRWFDLAEAVTGVRPQMQYDDEDESDE